MGKSLAWLLVEVLLVALTMAHYELNIAAIEQEVPHARRWDAHTFHPLRRSKVHIYGSIMKAVNKNNLLYSPIC